MNKKISTTLGITIVAVLAIVLAGIAVWQNYLLPDKEIEVADLTEEEIFSGWKTYKSAVMGFEIRYPNHLDVSDYEMVSTGIFVNFVKDDNIAFSVRRGGHYSQELMREYTMEEWIELQDFEKKEEVFFGIGDYKGIKIVKQGIATVFYQIEIERNFFKIHKEADLSLEDFDRILSTFKIVEVTERFKLPEIVEKEAVIMGDFVFSSDGELSAYIKNIIYSDEAVMEIYLRNEETKKEKVVRTNSCSLKRGLCPWPCHIGGFSPNNKYIVRNCGTGVSRNLEVIDTKTGEEMIQFKSGSFFYYWLDDENIVFDESQVFMTDFQKNQRPWESGEGYGITRINVLNGQKNILKKSDDFRDYFLVKPLDNGNILFILHAYPVEGDWERFLNPSISHWIMDINGNIIEEVYDLEKY